MLYRELQKMLLKYPFLYPLIENRKLSDIRIEIHPAKDFSKPDVTRLLFIMPDGSVYQIHYVANTLKEVMARCGRPKYVVLSTDDLVIHIYTLVQKKPKKCTFNVYEQPVTQQNCIHENVKLLGTAKVLSHLHEGVLLECLCDINDKQPHMHQVFVEYGDFTNPHEGHLPEAIFTRGSWTFVPPYPERHSENF